MIVRAAVRESLHLLSARDRRKLLVATAAQVASSTLDLVGVLLLGLVGALAVTTVQSQPPPTAVESVIDFLGLEDLTEQQVLVIFALSAAVVLLTKSLISSLLLRHIFRFLAGRQATVTASLTKLLLAQPLTVLLQRSSQETSYALVQGVGASTLVTLGAAVIVVSEASLLLLLGLALLIVSPGVAIASILFFSLVAVGLQFGLGNWASRSGGAIAKADVASLDAVQEVVGAYREVSVLGRRKFYADRIELLRWEAARAAADLQFIYALPKYVFEVALVVGGFALAGALLATQNSVIAVGTLALFLAAASRVMPSILRLQGATLTLRNAAGLAGPTLELAQQLTSSSRTGAGMSVDDTLELSSATGSHSDDFVPCVRLNRVSFIYSGGSAPAIDDVSIEVPQGASVAIVGRSGAGKSTLVDLILGVLKPSSGEVLLGDRSPEAATAAWPGAIAYVPQDIMLANASVRENVALGLPLELIDDEHVWEALRRSHLVEVFAREDISLETHIGERGVRLSGGQRQRLGIARALYMRPRLLVLDEATSALDAETEAAIGQTIEGLEGVVTTFIVAHRLATVRAVDTLVYLDNGRALSIGAFEQVRREVPAFDRQAEILGLH